MGEKLELKLKSPVGAEAAGYPWPLPVYVSISSDQTICQLTYNLGNQISTGIINLQTIIR
jgi:hypothetical protein